MTRTHGGKAIVAALNNNRLDHRTRRALRRIQNELTARPLEQVRSLAHGRLARLELRLQRYELWALQHPDEPPTKEELGLHHAWRRLSEFLALLEGRIVPNVETPGEYLRRRAQEAAQNASGAAESGDEAPEREHTP